MAVITISRHPGSLGDTVARGLAERLHYRLVERGELIHLAERIGGPDVAWDRAPELRERSPPRYHPASGRGQCGDRRARGGTTAQGAEQCPATADHRADGRAAGTCDGAWLRRRGWTVDPRKSARPDPQQRPGLERIHAL